MLKSTPQTEPAEPPDRAATAGGEGALDLRELFEREESRLLRYAFRLTGRRAVAEEIVQDVFLQLHDHSASSSGKRRTIDAPEAWLTRCVRNRAFDWRRKSRREILQSDETMDAGGPPNRQDAGEQQEAPSPDQQLAQMETSAALRGLIDDLGDQDRELVRLKYFAGMKYREISQQTGLSIGNVGYRLHHILKRLAVELNSSRGECPS